MFCCWFIGGMEGAEPPVFARIDCGRAFETPVIGSDFGVGQGTALCAFFRAAPVVPQLLISLPLADPFDCVDEGEMVPVEDPEDAEVIEEEEFARCALFRGINMRATSSLFMEFSPWPVLAPHADRLICWKLGGFATAVMCKTGRIHSTPFMVLRAGVLKYRERDVVARLVFDPCASISLFRTSQTLLL